MVTRKTATDGSQQSWVLPSLPKQAELLIEKGVPALLGTDPQELRAVVQEQAAADQALLVPSALDLDYSALMALATRDGKEGFVVEDMTDVPDFEPIPDAALPAADWYLLMDPVRGDEFQSKTPEEALKTIEEDGRTPLTINEGIFWLLQMPDVLEPGSCYMTIGSRKRKAKGGYDSRTPALWISGGTGRDGAARKNAAKLGWCWWRNHHTWLGVAHGANRTPAGN